MGLAWRLLVLRSPDRARVGRAKILGREPILLGRDVAAQGDCWVLDDPEVSRAHARLEWERGALQIRDLGSHNSTFVNGDRCHCRVLANGDVVRVGAHLLLCQTLDVADAERLVAPRPPEIEGLLGTSHRMLRLRELAVAAGRTEAPILLTGESGTGKELVARGIHAHSGRKGRLVTVNCAALPEQLAESELFGHARGAFTGASEASPGLFGEAEGGTLLLDEVGDMPLTLQAKLLRALATGEVRRVGQTQSRTVDVKVVAATHVPLADAVTRGSFRGDLYARLIGVRIPVPSLRARREDILPLFERFMARRKCRRGLTDAAAEALLCHHWPYNVRELEQLAVSLSTRGTLAPIRRAELPEDLVSGDRALAPGDTSLAVPSHPLLDISRDAAPTAEELARVLQHFDGSVAKTAEFFGKERRQVYRWATRLGIEPDAFRPD